MRWPPTSTWGGRPVRLFDTAGLRRKARISEKAEKLAASDAVRAIRFAEVVVLLIDAEHPFEHQDLTIGDLVDERGARAGRRRQQVGPRARQAEEAEGAARDRSRSGWRRLPGIPMVAISALAGSGLDRLMEAVFQQLRDLEPPGADARTSIAGWSRRWSGTRRRPPRAAASRSAS